MKKTILLLLIVASCFKISAQEYSITGVYPTHWWVGMKNPKLQIMVHGPSVQENTFTTSYPGVKITKVHKPENRNYVFLDLNISSATKPGTVRILVKNPDGQQYINYQLKAREKGNGVTRIKGVTSKDFVYLIMADRFSNGDPSNDQFNDLRDQVSDRNNPYTRHGGDLRGVQNKLDYLKDLGVTTVWMTPVLENDMPLMQEGPIRMSGYHGYWITNHFEVDKRHGGNAAYHDLVKAAHAKGMKIIQDAVYNHVGSEHHTVLDLPMKDWLNQWPSYQGANHRDEIFIDPYASQIDKKIMLGGWFVPHLPDLNLANPYVATYTIQNTIWSTEEFGIDGWRVDTYKYVDEKFLNDINTALLREFPSLTVFGEAWTNTITAAAYFTQNNINAPFKHNAQGVTDFPMRNAIIDAVNQPFGWTEGLNRLYMTLSQDLLYKDPKRNCIFLDNHDMDRVYSVVGEKLSNYKMAMGLLLTLRGIPQIYYGTEILMKNFKNPNDAAVRMDFPGGWSADNNDKFVAAGRTNEENEAFNFVRNLAQYRKNSNALTIGKTIQFIPQNSVYTYFRIHGNQTVMCMVNSSDNEVDVNLTRFAEVMRGFTKAKDVVGNEITLGSSLKIPGKTMWIYELVK